MENLLKKISLFQLLFFTATVFGQVSVKRLNDPSILPSIKEWSFKIGEIGDLTQNTF